MKAMPAKNDSEALQIGLYTFPPGELPVKMAKSDASAARLLKLHAFGADLIRFPPGGCVRDHTHPGNHILIVVSGHGWVDYCGTAYLLSPGMCYLVPGAVRHGIRAETELTLISVADNHRDAGADDRLDLVQGMPLPGHETA